MFYPFNDAKVNHFMATDEEKSYILCKILRYMRVLSYIVREKCYFRFTRYSLGVKPIFWRKIRMKYDGSSKPTSCAITLTL